MGRGTGEIGTTTTVAPRLRGGDRDSSETLEFKGLQEHWREMPASVNWIGNAVVVPCRRRHADGKKTVDAARWMVGSDNDLYVVRYRDIYRTRFVVKDQLESQEAATIYRGKSASDAVRAMNSQLSELNGDGFYSLSFEQVGGGSATPHDPKQPYRLGQVVDALESLTDLPQSERAHRALASFGLEP
jgi:hypothetical protein